MTDKTLGDLEFIAIQAPSSRTVHVMKATDHVGWGQGDPGVTVCGRHIAQMYIVQDIQSEDKPCKSCDRSLSVVAIMFETSDVIKNVLKEADRYNEQIHYMAWLSHGLNFGYISPPFCGLHNEVPLTQEELEDRQGGEDDCVYVVRVYGMSAQEYHEG